MINPLLMEELDDDSDAIVGDGGGGVVRVDGSELLGSSDMMLLQGCYNSNQGQVGGKISNLM